MSRSRFGFKLLEETVHKRWLFPTLLSSSCKNTIEDFFVDFISVSLVFLSSCSMWGNTRIQWLLDDVFRSWKTTFLLKGAISLSIFTEFKEQEKKKKTKMFPIPNRWWIHDTRIVNTLYHVTFAIRATAHLNLSPMIPRSFHSGVVVNFEWNFFFFEKRNCWWPNIEMLH